MARIGSVLTLERGNKTITGMDLRQIEETPLDTQQLLFDVAGPPSAQASRGEVPAEFQENGWVLSRNVLDIHDAIGAASSILTALDARPWDVPGVRLAKADRFPACDPVVQESFQALHFDMGLPLVERDIQVGFFFTLLYFPFGGEPGQAWTRIVNVQSLLEQRRFGTLHDCDRRLAAYADMHGDGWTEPQRHITGRLGCLARIVDAMLDEPELVHFFDQATWEWFRGGPASDDGHAELCCETDWWARHGYALNDMETRVQLQPGDFLLIDNVRCAHGRIGSRPPEQIWQVMWGVPHVGPEAIARMRGQLASALADNC